MFTKEEKDRMRQELLASFRPQPPPPPKTPAAISEERWAKRPDAAIMQDAPRTRSQGDRRAQ